MHRGAEEQRRPPSLLYTLVLTPTYVCAAFLVILRSLNAQPTMTPPPPNTHSTHTLTLEPSCDPEVVERIADNGAPPHPPTHTLTLEPSCDLEVVERIADNGVDVVDLDHGVDKAARPAHHVLQQLPAAQHSTAQHR